MFIIPLSLLIISFLVMMGMIYFKLVEIRTGRSFLFWGKKSDHILAKKIGLVAGFLERWDLKTIGLLFHFILEKTENFFLRVFHYIVNKFAKPVNMVKGQGNITQEKPSTSFFLKNIEEHKLSQEGSPEHPSKKVK